MLITHNIDRFCGKWELDDFRLHMDVHLCYTLEIFIVTMTLKNDHFLVYLDVMIKKN
jgi:hypothetical protein